MEDWTADCMIKLKAINYAIWKLKIYGGFILVQGFVRDT